ncbi:condensation domain-containing protein, partial [Undibacterium crateris]|uniref:condensation domain-containing protein n=1 Tax=Undibacterium crateris TaxID=2528175 RepID=UPI001389B664
MNLIDNPVLSADVRDYFELSGAQRAIWLDLHLGVNPIAYQLSGQARLHGDIDHALLHQAIRLLMARHDALRLRIDTQAPRQWLESAVTPPLRITALASNVAPDSEVERILSNVMPLGEHTLFQFDLLQTDTKNSIVVWRVHHLIADLITLDLMMQRWFEIYHTLIQEHVLELPSGSSFVSIVKADHVYSSSPQAAADLAYWQRRFETPPGILFDQVNAGEAQSPQASAHASQVRSETMAWSLEGAALSRWRTVCTQLGVTDQRVLLALLAVTLSRRQGIADFAIGLALHGRDFASKDVIGMLSRALPVRCHIQPESSLKQTICALSKDLDEDFRHQRTPIDDLCRAIGMSGSGRSRLYDAVMSYRQIPEQVREFRLGQLHITMSGTPALEMTPLSLYVTDIADQRMDFILGHDPAVIDYATCQRIAAALQQVIQVFCQSTGSWVCELDVIAPDERKQLLSLGCATQISLPQLAESPRLEQQISIQASAT